MRVNCDTLYVSELLLIFEPSSTHNVVLYEVSLTCDNLVCGDNVRPGYEGCSSTNH